MASRSGLSRTPILYQMLPHEPGLLEAGRQDTRPGSKQVAHTRWVWLHVMTLAARVFCSRQSAAYRAVLRWQYMGQ